MTDPEIRDIALNQFTSFALPKFNKGIEEHNPRGDKGLWKMNEIQLIKALKEEAADTWFYLNALEQKLMQRRCDEINKEFQMQSRKDKQFLSASAETENPEIIEDE
jgi:hypothetical protein